MAYLSTPTPGLPSLARQTGVKQVSQCGLLAMAGPKKTLPVAGSGGALLGVAFNEARPRGMLQFFKGFGLNLSNPLPGDVKLLTDLF